MERKNRFDVRLALGDIFRQFVLSVIPCFLLLMMSTIAAPQLCHGQATDKKFNRILTAAADRLDQANTIRLTVESTYTEEGSAGPRKIEYTLFAQRDNSLHPGCKIFGETSDGEHALFDGVRLLEGKPSTGRMLSFAAARQPQPRIANVLSGWDLAPLPMKDNLMREVLSDKDITERVISNGVIGNEPVTILSCVSSSGNGAMETFIEWHLRKFDLVPLKVIRLSKMAGVMPWSDEIYITSISVDPKIEPGLFSGSTFPENTVITEAPRPKRDGPKLLKKGDSAPSFEASALQGGSYKLSDFRGKVVFLDFFYASCFPCHRALPTLAKLDREFRKDGVVFLGIDSYDDIENWKLRKLVDSMKIEYPVLLTNRIVDRQYGVGAYPTAIIIDRNGIISYADSGFVKEFTPQEWREEILRVLEE